MHKFVLFNHKILNANQANISAISSSTLYGKGIFTTILINNSEPFLWQKHWRRLTQNAEKLGIDLSEFTEYSVKTSLTEIIKQNQVINGRARITFFDEQPSQIWSYNSENKTSFLITTDNLRKISQINLTVSKHRINSTSLLANIKSCNYLEKIINLQETKKLGFDEAICLNEKHEIVSAIMANIFWVKDNNIFTPSLETGCLAGTIREFLLENFSINQVQSNLSEIENADEIFLSSSGLDLCLANSSKTSTTFAKLKNFLDLSIAKT